MAKITTDEVVHLAALAMISLDSEEIDSLVIELESIFKMIEEINSIDTKAVRQTAQVTGLKHVTRKDEERDYGVEPKDLLSGAAKSRDNSIEVPSVK